MRLPIVIALTTAALSTFAVTSAWADTGGYFEIESHATIVGSESEGHHLDITAAGLEGEMGCSTTFDATNVNTKIADLSFFPLYKNCVITGTETKFSVDVNECSFTFQVCEKEIEQTVQLNCPAGKDIVITRVDCTINVPPQTINKGVTYKKITESGKSAITVTVDAELILRYEAGKCTSLGTTQKGTLKGSFTIKAYNTEGIPVGITGTWNTLGHFASGSAHPTITGSESGKHHLDFSAHGLSGEIGCEKSTYSLTDTSEIAEVTSVVPIYQSCSTTSFGGEVFIGFNECSIVFRALHGTSDSEQPVSLECPTGNSALILHKNCTINIPPQGIGYGITYTTVEESGHHAITVDVDIEFDVRFEGGICIFLGTNHRGTLKGSVTVKAQNTTGEQVSLTAT